MATQRPFIAKNSFKIGNSNNVIVDRINNNQYITSTPTQAQEAIATEWEIQQHVGQRAVNNNGFIEEPTISWSNASRTLTITKPIKIVAGNTPYLINTNQSVTITNTNGSHWIYFNTSGQLVTAQSAWDVMKHAPVYQVYWDKNSNEAIVEAYECHDSYLPDKVHAYLHERIGAFWSSGLTQTSFTTAGAPNADGRNTYVSLTSGVIKDEDISISITNSSGAGRWYQDMGTGVINGLNSSGMVAKLPIIYAYGTGGSNFIWRKDNATVFPFKFSGDVPLYNQFTGGVWTWTNVPANNFFVYWVIAGPDVNDPVHVVPHHTVYTSLANAQTGATPETIYTNRSEGLTPELKVLYRYIFEYRTTYSTAVKGSVIRNVTDYRTDNTRPITSAAAATYHSALAGLTDPNAHPATSINIADLTSFASNAAITSNDTTVQLALDRTASKALVRESVISGDGSISIGNVSDDEGNDKTNMLDIRLPTPLDADTLQGMVPSALPETSPVASVIPMTSNLTGLLADIWLTQNIMRADGSNWFSAPVAGIDPNSSGELTTKRYVDDQIIKSFVPGKEIVLDTKGTLLEIAVSNNVVLRDGSVPFVNPQSGAEPTTNTHLTTKAYVDQTVDTYVPGFDLNHNGMITQPNLSWSNATRTLTIWQPVKFVANNTVYNKTTNQSVTIGNNNGLNYIYFNSNGVLTHSQTMWDYYSHAPVYAVYWNKTSNLAILECYEAHNSSLGNDIHEYLHNRIGMQYISGLAITAIISGNQATVPDPDGRNAVVSLTSGVLCDEDITIKVWNNATTNMRWYQDLGTGVIDGVNSSGMVAKLPIVYSYGNAGDPNYRMRKDAANGYPFKFNENNKPVYNAYDAGDWSWAEVPEYAPYFVYWVGSTADVNDPIIIIPHQITYSTLQEALDDATPNIALQDRQILGFTELKALHRIIFQYSPDYDAGTKYTAIRNITDYRKDLGRSILQNSPGMSHRTLYETGEPNNHPARAINVAIGADIPIGAGRVVTSNSTDVQLAIEEISENALSLLSFIPGTNITLDTNGDKLKISATGGGTSNEYTVNQSSHGFNAGEFLRYTGTAYAKAQANTSTNSEVVGVVKSVEGVDDFTVTTPGGKLSIFSGLTAGETYFLSASTPGALSITEPSTIGYISKPLLVALSTTEGVFYNWRGIMVSEPAINLSNFQPGTNITLDTNGNKLVISATGGADLGSFEPGNNIVLSTNGSKLRIATSNKVILSDGSVSFVSPIAGVTPTSNACLTTKAYVDSSILTGFIPGTNITLTTNGTKLKIAATGGGSSNEYTVSQASHGLAAGEFVRFNGTNYVKAQADTSTNADVIGLVKSINGADEFTLATPGGKFTIFSGLTPGEIYFLSPTSAGALTATEPSAVGQISKPLVIATAATDGVFYNWRGVAISTPNSIGFSSFQPGNSIVLDTNGAYLNIAFNPLEMQKRILFNNP